MDHVRPSKYLHYHHHQNTPLCYSASVAIHKMLDFHPDSERTLGLSVVPEGLYVFSELKKKKKIHARVYVNWTMQKSAKKQLALSVMVNSSEGRNSEALSVSAGLSACSPSLSQKCDF